MPDTIEKSPGLGHNVPPVEPKALREFMDESFADLNKRRAALETAIEGTPAHIEDDNEEEAGKLADFVELQLDPYLKDIDAAHKKEKAPFLNAGRCVDGWKHEMRGVIEKGKEKVNKVRKDYADRKEQAERKRREEEARIARETARREAEEAERQRIEAEEAAAKLSEDDDLDDAIAAEEEADRKEEEAAKAQRSAEEAAKAATAKPAELGKTRGQYGGQTSLKRFWNFRNLERKDIDLEALREHLPFDALEQAVRSWTKANREDLREGKIKLRGVEIFVDTRL